MFVEIELAGSYRETAPQVKSLLRRTRPSSFRFDTFYRTCETIRRDRRTTTVLVHAHPSFRAGSVAALEEIRDAIARLVATGKTVLFYSADYRDGHLFLASACSRRLIHPLGSLRCTGLAQTRLHVRRLADRLDIRVRIVRRGKYKSAMDALRVEEIDPADLEQFQALLDESASLLHAQTAAGYGRAREDLQPLLDGAILDAEAAIADGWIDAAEPPDALKERWNVEKLRRRKIRVPDRLGRGKQLAVLTFEGAIADGANRVNPVTGQTIGAAGFVRHVDSLRRSRKVRAVVLRVNSGGGAATASEDVRAALERLAQAKPLVVSMSAVAGSGGYWISTPGSSILARATTVTGSIGVINVAMELGPALAARGVTHSTVRTHDHADAGTGFRELTEDEVGQLDRQVQSVYDRFIALVASSRRMRPEDAAARAQGRVWSGAAALEQGLVDRIGGLAEAIDEARTLAGLANARVEFLPRVRYSFLERLVYRSGGLAFLRAGAARFAPGAPAHALAGRAAEASTTGPLGCAAASAIADLAGRPLLLDPTTLFHPDVLGLLDADIQIE